MTFAAMLCLSGMAHAQTLYRCSRGSIHSYQQTACPPSWKTLGTMQVAPEPPPTALEQRQRVEKAEQDRAESAFLSHQAGMDVSVSRRYPARRARTSGRLRNDDTCQTAVAASSAARKAIGWRRTYEDLQRLDQDTREACSRG
jgi:hypothetical protein